MAKSRILLVALATATGLAATALLTAAPASALPLAPSAVITADTITDTIDVAVSVDAVGSPTSVTTSILIEVFTEGGDDELGPDGIPLYTGASCTITHASTTSAWSDTCFIPGVPRGLWFAVRATPRNLAGPGTVGFSNYVIAAADTPSVDPQSASNDTPPDRMQAVGRMATQDCTSIDDTNLDWGTGLHGGWHPSWAEWFGGAVCVREFTYANGGWRIKG